MVDCKPYVNEIIVVEGKYDKNILLQIIDATVITTNGFRIFKDKNMQNVLRRLANERGIIILTDPDGAGLVIRNFLTKILPPNSFRHIFVPEIEGKEKRKKNHSKANILGVEGMTKDIILRLFNDVISTPQKREIITKATLYEWGLSGGVDSEKKRKNLQAKLNLPSNISAKTLCDVLTMLYTKEEILPLLA